jgi:YD repeat-containing protein
MLLQMQGNSGTSRSPTWIAASLGATLLLYLLLNLTWNVLWRSLATRRTAYRVVAMPEGPVVPVNQLMGTGRIYLVQIGLHDSSYVLNDFAEWLRSKYALDVQVLQPTTLDPSAWNNRRRQIVAELLYEQVKREHPDLAVDSNAYLIGFTDADMYSVYWNWPFSYSQRYFKARAAVISSARLRDTFWERIGVDENIVNAHLQARLRRFLLKDIAVLYWHLPLNHDPNSVLHQALDPDLPGEDIYLSDLHPERTRWGRFEGEPCIFLAYSSKDGIRTLPGNLIRSCDEEDEPVQQNESTEVFEVDLRLGLLIDKHTDFYLPGSIPIEFRRALRDGWKVPMAYGLSGTHNYDKFLKSADMRRISIVHEDGGRYDLDRVPAWLPFLSFVKYVNAADGCPGELLELRWHSSPFEHFDVKWFNGEVEMYLPCDSKPLCYLTGYRNARGEELVFDRDGRRRLTRLTSPNQSWLRLSYDEAGRISEIDDSRRRTIFYSYDKLGRLSTVRYPSGEILNYGYDSMQHLLTFAVAPNAEATPRLLLRNEYEHGRLAKQIFDDGKVYSYSYFPTGDGPIERVIVRTPENKIFDLDVGEEESSVRERPTQAKPQESGLPQ